MQFRGSLDGVKILFQLGVGGLEVPLLIWEVPLLIWWVGWWVGLTVMIGLVSVKVKLNLNCQLELSLAKNTYKTNFLIKRGHIQPTPCGK